MPATNQALPQGRLKHLSPMKHTKYEDMVVVVGRASKGFKQLFQKEYLPVIMSSTRTAWLIMMWAHSQDHSGVDNTYLASMQVAWVVGGRSLARGIKRSCVRCRFLAKLLLDQQMSVLPAHLAVPSPCFTLKKGGSLQKDNEECWYYQGLGCSIRVSPGESSEDLYGGRFTHPRFSFNLG